MSQYTAKMESEMTAKGSFTYAEAQAYAAENGLSVRSVVSKIKSLGLAYEKKPVTKSVTGKVETKAEIVAEIAHLLEPNSPTGALEGLAKADKSALSVLRKELRALVAKLEA